MKRGTRANWPLRLVIGVFLLSIVVYFLARESFAAAEEGFVDRAITCLLEVCVAAWFFVLGASIGSFLNVVVYRLPRGETLLGQSYCPKCKSSIAFRDNVPVFGWLLLRGRCRRCELPISARYPTVEALTGLVFLQLAACELFAAGINLPIRPPELPRGITAFMTQPDLDLVAIYAYHACLCSVLIVVGLIQIDRQPVPRSLVACGALVAIFTPLVWPSVQPVGWQGTVESWPPSLPWQDRLATSLAGGIFGTMAGLVFTFLLGEGRQSASLALGLIGLFLGWQATIGVILLAALPWAVMRWPARSRTHNTCSVAILLAATLVQISAWRFLVVSP